MVLNYSLPLWGANSDSTSWQADAVTVTLATQAATSFDVVSITPPIQALDWWYDLTFYGPSLQCSEANSTEQPVFNELARQFEENDSTFIYSQVNDSYWEKGQNGWLLFSAWSPALPSDAPNSWLPSPSPTCTLSCPYTSLQLWVQTSTSNFVCNPVNALFSVTFGSINGTQYVTQRDVQVEEAQPEVSDLTAYFAHFWALSGILMGNLSMGTSYFSTNSNPAQQILNTPYSNILSTGLIACSDIQDSPFQDVYVSSGLTANESSAFANAFDIQPGMCRNGTLARAIEDLANNITLSYLSAAGLSDKNTTARNITTSNTRSVYEYHPLYLLLSYGIALGCASVAAVVGVWAAGVHGAVRLGVFSGVMKATRNEELDALVSEEEEDFRRAKLRFGTLIGSQDKEGKDFLSFGLKESIR
jgi:hypothetical protein